jgi:hypothetical protein
MTMTRQRTKSTAPTSRPRGELAAQTRAVVVARQQVLLDSETGRALIEDFTRYTEELLDDEDLCGAWRMNPSELTALKNDTLVVEAVRRTKYRREQDGSAAREAARKAFLKAPRVLERILDDPLTPPRGRIEASRELRAAAAFPTDSTAGSGEMFSIVINLGPDRPPVTSSGPVDPARFDDSDIIDATPSRHSQATKRGTEGDE